MSDHDCLMSALIKMQKHLEGYVQEYDPLNGTRALEHIGQVLVLASKFPGEACELELAAQGQCPCGGA